MVPRCVITTILSSSVQALRVYKVRFPHNNNNMASHSTLTNASTGPAWNNENLARLALSIQTPLMFAHVRAATIGTKVCECK